MCGVLCHSLHPRPRRLIPACGYWPYHAEMRWPQHACCFDRAQACPGAWRHKRLQPGQLRWSPRRPASAVRVPAPCLQRALTRMLLHAGAAVRGLRRRCRQTSRTRAVPTHPRRRRRGRRHRRPHRFHCHCRHHLPPPPWQADKNPSLTLRWLHHAHSAGATCYSAAQMWARLWRCSGATKSKYTKYIHIASGIRRASRSADTDIPVAMPQRHPVLFVL